MTRLRTWMLTLAGFALVAVAAPAAFAADPSESVYGGLAGNVQDVIGGETAGEALPFTGLNLALIVLGGLVLLGTGLLLRRRTGSSSS